MTENVTGTSNEDEPSSGNAALFRTNLSNNTFDALIEPLAKSTATKRVSGQGLRVFATDQLKSIRNIYIESMKTRFPDMGALIALIYDRFIMPPIVTSLLDNVGMKGDLVINKLDSGSISDNVLLNGVFPAFDCCTSRAEAILDLAAKGKSLYVISDASLAAILEDDNNGISIDELDDSSKLDLFFNRLGITDQLLMYANGTPSFMLESFAEALEFSYELYDLDKAPNENKVDAKKNWKSIAQSYCSKRDYEDMLASINYRSPFLQDFLGTIQMGGGSVAYIPTISRTWLLGMRKEISFLEELFDKGHNLNFSNQGTAINKNILQYSHDDLDTRFTSGDFLKGDPITYTSSEGTVYMASRLLSGQSIGGRLSLVSSLNVGKGNTQSQLRVLTGTLSVPETDFSIHTDEYTTQMSTGAQSIESHVDYSHLARIATDLRNGVKYEGRLNNSGYLRDMVQGYRTDLLAAANINLLSYEYKISRILPTDWVVDGRPEAKSFEWNPNSGVVTSTKPLKVSWVSNDAVVNNVIENLLESIIGSRTVTVVPVDTKLSVEVTCEPVDLTSLLDTSMLTIQYDRNIGSLVSGLTGKKSLDSNGVKTILVSKQYASALHGMISGKLDSFSSLFQMKKGQRTQFCQTLFGSGRFKRQDMTTRSMSNALIEALSTMDFLSCYVAVLMYCDSNGAPLKIEGNPIKIKHLSK